MEQLKQEIDSIKARNESVEKDKAWETSWTRRIILAGLTYLAIGLYMQAIEIENAWLNAIVPAVGFMLSTLTLPFFKKIWMRFNLRSKSHN